MGLFEDDEDLVKLKKEQDAANDKKGYLGAAGNILQGLVDRPSGYEIYTKTKSSRPDVKGMFGAVSDTVQDPMSQQEKAYAFLKNKRESNQYTADNKADSDDSKAMAEQIGGMFPQFAPFVSGKSKAQIKEMMPILSQKIRGDTERENAKIAAGGRLEARADAAQARKDALEARREDKLEARALKQQELSGPQAKQRGLYESGLLAEQQYNKAIADKKDYDPTQVGQIIDNSGWAPNWMKNDKAIAAQAAQSAWIEGFLRDASGAAIPPSERMAYAKDFFAQPGDSPDVVANKNALRQQKMENARIASGVETGHGPALVQREPVQKPTLNKKDEQAISWALSNPGDIRAKQILNAHGLSSDKAIGSNK
jgi:hypothetical protein